MRAEARRRRLVAAACAVLLYAGAVGYHVASTFAHGAASGEAVALARPLRALPGTLGTWSGTDAALRQEVVDVAKATDYLSRVYRRPGAQVHVYISYYGQPLSAGPHDPRLCYRVAGWQRIGQRHVDVPLNDGTLPASELLFERDGALKAVQLWYVDRGVRARSWRRPRQGVLSRSLRRERPWVLQVEISADVAISPRKAYEHCAQLAAELWPPLSRHLPDVQATEAAR